MREAVMARRLLGSRQRGATKERRGPEVQAELEPTDPGAWAAWARERERELAAAVPSQSPATTREPPPEPVTPGRLEMHAAVWPRNFAWRMQR